MWWHTNGLEKFIINLGISLFFGGWGWGARQPCVTHLLGRDHRSTPSLGNFGLSHNYCDWGVTDFTLAFQES